MHNGVERYILNPKWTVMETQANQKFEDMVEEFGSFEFLIDAVHYGLFERGWSGDAGKARKHPNG